MFGRNASAKNIAVIAAMFVAVLLCIVPADASFNSFQFFIGDRASGMGGASTALADDPAALWYNPAGLALMKKSQINISGNSYSFINRTREGAVHVELASGTEEDFDIEESDFSIIPTSLVYGYRIGGESSRLAMAFGMFVPYANSIQATIDETVASGTEHMEIYSLLRRDSRFYIFSGGAGYALNRYLNIGASLGIGYISDIMSQEWKQYYNNSVGPVARYFSRYENTEAMSVTVTGNVGMQLILSGHRIGLFFRAPHLLLYNDSQYKKFIDSADQTGINQPEKITETPEPHKRIPSNISLGYAFEKAEGFAFSLEASWYLKSDELDRHVFNFSGGIEYYIAETMIVRSGLFTDFSQADKLDEDSMRPDRLDYYGGTLAFSLLNRVDGKLFTTTIGVVYRLGIGEYQTSDFGTGGSVQIGTKDWTTHDVALYLSESVAF